MDKKDVSAYDKIEIDLGNEFKVIQDKLAELVLAKKISIRDAGLFYMMVYFEKPFSTELEIPFKDFAESIYTLPSNLRTQLKHLVDAGVIRNPSKDIYTINLDYGSRGKEVFKGAYEDCGATIDIKSYKSKNKTNDTKPQRNNGEEEVVYSRGWGGNFKNQK